MFDEVDEQKDRMALATIYQALSEDILLMVAEKDSTKLAWEMLKTMHDGVERVKEAKLKTLKTHFEAIHMKNGESVDDFSIKLTFIVTGIRSLEEKIEEIFVINKFLRAYVYYVFECPNKRLDDEANLNRFYDEEPKLMFVKVVTNVLPKNDEANLNNFYDEELTFMFAEGVTNVLSEDDETNLEEFVQELFKEEPDVVMLNEEKVMENIIPSGNEYNHTDMWYIDNGERNHKTGH
ncbi:uncharacterized protein LOC124910368 [Impatiens glandulifera]|uniref:uncharacterized protein LOC124910368 n=1 Tax=Impatiens glandulifera TaxID=253017 RepID=UPI001FB11626|nr:uncharacterized protein LOC124910368 [Impatiens glandulifera]